ncbi:hypothetical protein Mapa_010412 [Marchantia paleacea]|nr:hypothetical protein Mapa_010412 [Marchantia paleacea]
MEFTILWLWHITAIAMARAVQSQNQGLPCKDCCLLARSLVASAQPISQAGHALPSKTAASYNRTNGCGASLNLAI